MDIQHVTPAPMKLTVTGKRTRRQGVVTIRASKDCTVLRNPGQELAIHVEVFGRRDTAFVNFHLKRNCKITLNGRFEDLYLYCIKWRLAEMKYELKVH